MKRKITIASTGSIAVLDIPRLIMLLRRALSCEVMPILSEGALNFITSLSIGYIAGVKPLSGRSDNYSDAEIEAHIYGCQLYILAPATAHCIAQIANGYFNSLPSRGAALFKGPILVAPAMNEFMWNNPATQRNIISLSDRGFHIIGPSLGLEIATFQSSRTSMSTPDQILESIIAIAPLDF